MKLFLALCFVAVALFGVAQGFGLETEPRRTRALAIGECPLSIPLDKCEEYAKKQFQNSCMSYELHGRSIGWASCGVVYCGLYWKETDEDLSLPYPQCCPTCVPNSKL